MVLRPNSRENIQLLALWMEIAHVEIHLAYRDGWSVLQGGALFGWKEYLKRQLKAAEPLHDSDSERQFRLAK
jgi:hypothetical protein